MKRHRLGKFFFGLARLSPTRQQMQFKAIPFPCDPCGFVTKVSLLLWKLKRESIHLRNHNDFCCLPFPPSSCFWGSSSKHIYFGVVACCKSFSRREQQVWYYMYEKHTTTKNVQRETKAPGQLATIRVETEESDTHNKTMLYLWQFSSFSLLYPRSASTSVSFFYFFF
jgi:hypothetical protein